MSNRIQKLRTFIVIIDMNILWVWEIRPFSEKIIEKLTKTLIQNNGICGFSINQLIKYIFGFWIKLKGLTELRFKPAYNPYTEPSMEIFAFHKGLKKWVEIGNSGIFRPEMLLPMNLPSNVSVIAWGLSLERYS